jgi:hypothetical protein
MTVHFDIEPDADGALHRTLLYRMGEYSFDTTPSYNRGFTSALLDDLHLELDDSNRIISVWGLCPHTRWIDSDLAPPAAQQNSLILVSDRPLVRGVSIPINTEKYLPVYADPKSGWVQIKEGRTPTKAVTIFSGVIFELTDEGHFCSLWLKAERI